MSNRLLKCLRQGVLFVLSGPSGTGKNTLVHRLRGEFPEILESVSYTTRAPRENEEEGKHYYFVTEKEFTRRIEQGEFLEYAHHFGHYYGTSKQWTKTALTSGKHVFLVIDTQGALSLKDKVQRVSIFLAPPSFAALKQRLQMRKAETEAAIAKRLTRSVKEISDSKYYDYLIINDELDAAYEVLRGIVIAEVHRTDRQAEEPFSDLFLSNLPS